MMALNALSRHLGIFHGMLLNAPYFLVVLNAALPAIGWAPYSQRGGE